MNTSPVPPGWPERVQPPGSPGWEESARRWLYDQVPGEWRRYHVLYKHPLMLARDVRYLTDGSLQVARAAYSRARVELAENFEPHAIEERLRAYAEEGARLNVLARQVQLVEDALSGVRWVPKL
ncbi:hypothetical protein [Streptacidiphilus neutrinimicus]|uniref:hypothetical protein n=1 Tax=Streptacidiphilus neutrinimicus TaxID=105420 RepID=UPI0005A62529|nr:hypothetical protein [Streptacidiphilus neutrinimicus]